MCGVGCFFVREAVPNYDDVIEPLFRWAEKRGQDGVGYFIFDTKNKTSDYKRWAKPYSKVKKEVRYALESKLTLGSLLVLICRAAPETEPSTDENEKEKTLQPIISSEHGVWVVHNGAVSNFIHLMLKSWGGYSFKTNIDSESIIASYINVYNNRNMKDTMQMLSGVYAIILYDSVKNMLYVANDFKPIAHGYIKGVGFMLASDNDCLGEIIHNVTGCSRDGVCMWENYYHHYLSGGRIKEIDLESGFIRNIKYRPRYITQNWDSHIGNLHADDGTGEHVIPYDVRGHRAWATLKGEKLNENPDKELCLVAASGGLDSSLTLAILKIAGYDVVACHFKYGHRGQECEEAAITMVCDKLNVALKVFDLQEQYKTLDPDSMLLDKDASITTGTKQGLKKLDAWVHMRNTQFLTWMATYAEEMVFKYDFQKVYFLGGFLNLTESGHYPDNSEYFISSFIEHLKYGSLIGDRVQPLYCLSNLMKHEIFVLIRELGLIDVYKHTISCDRPRMILGEPCNCSKNGMPACGSGLLSYWASKMVDMDDFEIRNFYEVEDEYEAHMPQHLKDGFTKNPNFDDIVSRILLPEDKLDKIREYRKVLTV